MSTPATPRRPIRVGCPLHWPDEPCDATCTALRVEWRRICQNYSTLWKERRRGVKPLRERPWETAA